MDRGRRIAQQFLHTHELPADWRVLGDRIEATFVAASFSEGARFLPRIGELADELDHHPDVDLRYPGAVHISLVTHARGGLTELDARLAAALSTAAAEAGLRSEPTVAIRVALVHHADAAAPFWVALLAYRELRPADGDGPVRLVDARRISPPLGFGPDRAEDRPPGLAIRLDVAADVAAERVAAAVEAGGRVVEQRPEEGTWLLADPTGVLVELLVPPA